MRGQFDLIRVKACNKKFIVEAQSSSIDKSVRIASKHSPQSIALLQFLNNAKRHCFVLKPLRDHRI